MSAAKPIPVQVQAAVAELATDLHAKSGGEKFGLTCESFAGILCEVATRYLSAEATQADTRDFLLTLRTDELALARACAAGNNCAWEFFLTRYRDKLYHHALRIAREDSAAHDLADSLYAELYGLATRDGERVSKLASFSGRGSLDGWLRTVLAQEFVNRCRRAKHLVNFDDKIEEGAQFAAPQPDPAQSVDSSRLESVTDEVLAALISEDRLILSAYYIDGRPLAEVGHILGVHESTISRKVAKLAKTLRKNILAGMMRQGMGRREAEEALEVDVRDLKVNIRRSLAQEVHSAAFSEKRNAGPFQRKASPEAKG